MLRVDSCLVPPGWIASARMYSLVLENNQLYMIFTGPGPASQIDYTRGLLKLRQSSDGLTNLATTAVVNNYIGAIQQTEAKISPVTLQTLCNNKNSGIFPASSISELKMVIQRATIKLSFKANGKKYDFDCSLLTQHELHALVTALGGQVETRQ